ncbi:hypothetical protein HJG60_011334 [Phyllostomus discolor]|uniref:Uncharacterized protein n=1 Tax=Phyllostomus discolor TaxID=89673 RepID=A0A834A7Q1_9CHIR|nr:hypothetical protein HJG60_011334 [Phyllostomus discolor]
METSDLPDSEFKTLVLRIVSELRGRVVELGENFNKEKGNIKVEIESLKNNQSEMKKILSKMKNILQGINSRVEEAKNQIHDLEYKKQIIPNQNSKNKKESKKNEASVETSGTTSSIPTFTLWVCRKENRERKKLKTYLKI